MGRLGVRDPIPLTAMEAEMAAFVGLPWGRYVYVREHSRFRKGKWERVRPHFRRWPS